MSITVVGTMAFDAIETPFHKTDKIISGSAAHVAYAAAKGFVPASSANFYCRLRFSPGRATKPRKNECKN